MKKMCLAVLTAVVMSCAEDKPGMVFPDPEPVAAFSFAKGERIFGFYGEHRYSYCPSVVKEADGTSQMFFCGNPEQITMVDNIYHVKVSQDGTVSKEKSVLQPGPLGSWDDHHTCDPSVVEGEYRMAGKTYRYALFYLTNPYSAYYNEIGVAFSNDLSADAWVKYPRQIVKKPWSHEGDELLASGGKSWGVGQPSAFTVDKKGKVLLTYTVGDMHGTRIEWAEMDFSNMDNFVSVPGKRMVDNGLFNSTYAGRDYTCNADFAVNRAKNVVVMVRPVQPHPTTYPAFLNESLEVNYLPLTDFVNGTGKWEAMVRITPSLTGFARNHNAGLERNSFGEIEDWENPVVYYTVSKAAPEVSPGATTHAEWTYHIYRGKVTKN